MCFATYIPPNIIIWFDFAKLASDKKILKLIKIKYIAFSIFRVHKQKILFGKVL